MAADGKVHAIDIGNVWWQDVDTPATLQKAERSLRQAS
jgi:NDP-sugar pyrophosphorylase family protein